MGTAELRINLVYDLQLYFFPLISSTPLGSILLFTFTQHLQESLLSSVTH